MENRMPTKWDIFIWITEQPWGPVVMIAVPTIAVLIFVWVNRK